MANYQAEQLSLPSAYLGLLLEPICTVESLCANERPRHVGALFLALIAAIFLPIVSHCSRLHLLGTLRVQQALVGLGLLIAISLLTFLILECWLFLMLAIECTPLQVFSCLAYGFAPLSFAVCLTYALNYYSTGNLSLVDVLIMGGAPTSRKFLQALPWIIGATAIDLALIFYVAVRIQGQLPGFTSFFVTLLSVLIFTFTLAFGLFIGEVTCPGLLDTVLTVFRDPTSLADGPISGVRTLMP